MVPLEAVASVKYISTPTVVDHYQLRRVFDVYVMPKTEDLGRVGRQIQHIRQPNPSAARHADHDWRINQRYEGSFRSLRLGWSWR